MVGRAKILVNSLHAQAIDQVAPGLVVEAVAPDGTIEAVRVAGRAAAGRSACNGTRNGVTPTIRRAWRSLPRSARRAGPIRRDCERRHEMDLGLHGKTALITGGSKGIGRASAEVLADEGCNVVLVAREQAALDAAAAAIRARRQVNVRTISADLSSDAAVRRVAAEAGELDILVNNAGAIPPGDLLSVDDERWRRAWDLKVFGYISFCRVVYGAMKARRAGVIVNVIGSAGEKFPTGYIAGAAGNASLMAFTRALGKGAPADGLRVVAINPGPVETERHVMLQRDRAMRELGDAERWRGAEQGDAVRASGDAGGDRQCGGVPGEPEVGVHVGDGADDRWGWVGSSWSLAAATMQVRETPCMAATSRDERDGQHSDRL